MGNLPARVHVAVPRRRVPAYVAHRVTRGIYFNMFIVNKGPPVYKGAINQ